MRVLELSAVLGLFSNLYCKAFLSAKSTIFFLSPIFGTKKSKGVSTFNVNIANNFKFIIYYVNFFNNNVK